MTGHPHILGWLATLTSPTQKPWSSADRWAASHGELRRSILISKFMVCFEIEPVASRSGKKN